MSAVISCALSCAFRDHLCGCNRVTGAAALTEQERGRNEQ